MKKVFFALMLGLAVVACEPAEYDDSALKDQIADLDGRLTKVEEDLATLQLNVDAMKILADALKNGKYITSYVALEDGTGYTLTFNDGESIVVKHGEKGDQGETGEKGDKGDTGEAGVTPTVTVQEVDGVLYWFINGVQGPAIYDEAPKFSSVDGNLYVTYPGGEPQFVGALTGVSIFKSVVVDEEAGTVTFTFVGEEGQAGDSFVLYLEEAFALEISASVGLKKDQTEVDIPYEVKGANATTKVDVLTVACEAVVETEVIKVSNIAAGAQLLVFADNGEGKTSIKKVVFDAENYSVEAVTEVIPAEGGQVVVKGISNVAFDVVIPAEATWLTQVVAKSAFELTFSAEKNEGEDRSAVVSFVRQGTEEVLMSVTIAQAAAAKVEGIVSVERVWNITSENGSPWQSVIGFSANEARNIAMDDEYIYVTSSNGTTPMIKAISIADKSVVKDVNVEGISGGTHLTSCCKVIKNTDEAINGGKDVLFVCNLGNGSAVNLYMYLNGIDNAPTVYVLNNFRRYGDKFTYEGTLQEGEIRFLDWGTTGAVGKYPVKNGKIATWQSDGGWDPLDRFGVPKYGGIGEVVTYPGSLTYALYTTQTKGIFVTLNGVAHTEVAWTTDPNLDLTYGYTFFDYNNKKYIAYARIDDSSRANGSLEIIEDKGTAEEFQASLEAQSNLISTPVLDSDSPLTAGSNVAACAVHEDAEGNLYAAVCVNDCGLALYRIK